MVACPTCVNNETSHRLPAGLHPLPVPHRYRSEITLDFVSGLPPSKVRTSFLTGVHIFKKKYTTLFPCGNFPLLRKQLFVDQLVSFLICCIVMEFVQFKHGNGEAPGQESAVATRGLDMKGFRQQETPGKNISNSGMGGPKLTAFIPQFPIKPRKSGAPPSSGRTLELVQGK